MLIEILNSIYNCIIIHPAVWKGLDNLEGWEINLDILRSKMILTLYNKE
jgi:hypothetical protein